MPRRRLKLDLDEIDVRGGGNGGGIVIDVGGVPARIDAQEVFKNSVITFFRYMDSQYGRINRLNGYMDNLEKAFGDPTWLGSLDAQTSFRVWTSLNRSVSKSIENLTDFYKMLANFSAMSRLARSIEELGRTRGSAEDTARLAHAVAVDAVAARLKEIECAKQQKQK